MTTRQFQNLSALRIYFKRGDNKKASSWWGRLTEKPLSSYLLQSALKSGVTQASVNLGHMGFVKDAKSVSFEQTEISLKTLPVCLELLGPRRLLEQFIRDQAKHLKEATLLMVDGMHLSAFQSGIDVAIEKERHDVEYMKAGDISIPVEHIAAPSL